LRTEGRCSLIGLELRRRITGSNVNLLAVFDGDLGMATEVCDVTHDGNDVSAEVGEVADLGAVMVAYNRPKSTLFTAGAEEQIRIAGSADDDAEDASGYASMLADQLRGS
jgi:hypothetical protein